MPRPRLLIPVLALSSAPVVAAPQIEFSDGFRQEFDELVLFDADGDLGTAGDQVRVTGQAGLEVETELSSSSLLSPDDSAFLLELENELVAVAALAVEADVDASFNELVLLPISLPPIPIATIQIPAGPSLDIVVVYKAAVQLTGSLEAGARVDLALELPFDPDFTFDPGLGIDNEVDPFNHLFTANPEVTGNVGGSVTARVLSAVEFQPWISTLVPLPGPSFLAGPRLTLEVDPLDDPWWRLRPSFDVLFHVGVLGVSSVVPLTVVDTFDFPPIDAGGPINGGNQRSAERYARNYDFGLFDFPTFVIEAQGDPYRSFFGSSSNLVGFIEEDGTLNQAWSWLSHSPNDAAPADGSYRLAGITAGNGWIGDFNGSSGFSLSRRYDFEADGQVWNAQFERIVRIADGGHIVAGEAAPGISNTKRRFVMRIDAAGDVVWAKLLGNGLLDGTFLDMEVTDTDRIIVMGLRNEGFGAINGLELDALDLDGNPIWTRTFVDTLEFIHRTASMTLTQNSIHIVGTRAVNLPAVPDDLSIWTRRLSIQTGAEIQTWVQGQEYQGVLGLGTTDTDEVTDVVSAGTRVWVTGFTDAEGFAGWIWNSSVGAQLAQAGLYSTPSTERFLCMRTMPDGGLLTLGFSSGFGTVGNNDILAVRSGALPLVELNPDLGGSTTAAAFRAFPQVNPPNLQDPSPILELNATTTDVSVGLFGAAVPATLDVER